MVAVGLALLDLCGAFVDSVYVVVDDSIRHGHRG